MSSTRRTFIRKAPVAAAAVAAATPVVAGTATPAAAAAHGGGRLGPPWLFPRKKVNWLGDPPTEQALFSPVVTYGGLVYISGIGAHFEGDIAAHTDHVLSEVERYLEAAGSSMEKVLKVNVYLSTLDDYDGMNEVYLGRWGKEPGVRTTIAAAGIPGDSLVEIDCIACL